MEDTQLHCFPIPVLGLAIGPKWNWLVQHKPILSPSKVLEPLAHPDGNLLPIDESLALHRYSKAKTEYFNSQAALTHC